MKQTKEPFSHTGTTGLGGISTTTRERFEVEKSDVGHSKEHYLGYNHATHRFRSSDIGREIETIRDGTGWHCWSFVRAQ